jgi:Uma2 family endonuclease
MGVVLDQREAERIIEERRQRGARTGEEVWDGVIHIMPNPNNEHQDLAYWFGFYFAVLALMPDPRGMVNPSPNLSDRIEGWTQNFRNPDFAYFTENTRAEDHDTHWYGGPDFLLEILSPGDKAREKLPFYAKIGTREVLLLDRDPWQLELYQLKRGKLKLVGQVGPGGGEVVSGVVPLAFSLVAGDPRPRVRMRQTVTGQNFDF